MASNSLDSTSQESTLVAWELVKPEPRAYGNHGIVKNFHSHCDLSFSGIVKTASLNIMKIMVAVKMG